MQYYQVKNPIVIGNTFCLALNLDRISKIIKIEVPFQVFGNERCCI